MADATLSEIVTRVLQKLHVLNAGETVEAEDQALIQDIIGSVNEQLRDREICYWSDSAFPRAIKEAFADYVCCHATGDYPSAEVTAKYGGQANKDRFFGELARLCSSRERVDAPTKADFF